MDSISSYLWHPEQQSYNVSTIESTPFVGDNLMSATCIAESKQDLINNLSEESGQNSSLLDNGNVESTGIVVRSRQLQFSKLGQVKQGFARRRIRFQTHISTSAGPNVNAYDGGHNATSDRQENYSKSISTGESRTRSEADGHDSEQVKPEV